MRQIAAIERDLHRMERYFETVVDTAECLRCMRIISELLDERDLAFAESDELKNEDDISLVVRVANIASPER